MNILVFSNSICAGSSLKVMKQNYHGIGENVLFWVGNPVEGWKQRVQFNGYFPEWRKVSNALLQKCWSSLVVFAQQSLIFIHDLEKGVHAEGYLDGVKLLEVITWCAVGKKSRRPHKSEWVKRWQIAFEVDWCKVKFRITCPSWKFKLMKSWSHCCQLSEIFGSNCSRKKPQNNRGIRHHQEGYWEQQRRWFPALWEILVYSYLEYSVQVWSARTQQIWRYGER